MRQWGAYEALQSDTHGRVCRAAQHERNASTSVLQEDQWFGGSIVRQQKNIRMGLGQLAGNRKPERRRQPSSEAAQRSKLPSQAMPPVWSQP